MSLAQPFWLWLLPVALWLVWKHARAPGPQGALRGLLWALACLVLAGPRLQMGGRGMDVVVVLDESLSVAETERQGYRELVQTIHRRARAGDRLGLVRFGAATRVEKRPEDEHLPGAWQDLGRQNRSDLVPAVEAALRLVPESRAARLVLMTDGEFGERAAEEAARAAALRGVPVDVWKLTRPDVRDVAVHELQTPPVVAPGEPFQFTAWVQGTAAARVSYELRRNREPVTRGAIEIGAGLHPILLRDVLATEGVHAYELVVSPEGGDRVAENNRARSVVTCRSRPTVLVVSRRPDGNLPRLLADLRIPYEVAGPEAAAAAVSLENLNRHAGLILENVNAEALGNDGLRAVRQYVMTFGGGLLMTGGRESFGAGGYFKSPVEECLPVTLEVRKEVRKNRMSLAVALDRSGSMAVPVAGGLEKMDLANNGTIEAIRMLGPMDRVSVIAVDSAAHLIVPLAAVDDPGTLIATVRKIRSEGGGIYVYEALKAGYDQLMKSDTAVRHMILFADAADSEEPGDYRRLLAEFRARNMTVSVIGLGSDRDSDAGLLMDVARLGNGRIFFTDRPEELPRLFSYETILADRSAYVEEPVSVRSTAAALSVLSALPGSPPSPALQAYNLGYPKPSGQAAWMTQVKEDDADGESTALWAFGASGVGRSAVLLFDVNGSDSRPLQAWGGFRTVLGSAVRWTLDTARPDAVLEVRRDGHDLVATLDVEPALQQRLTTAPVLAVVSGAGGDAPQYQPMRQQPNGTWQSIVPLEDTGLYHAAVQLGAHGVVRAPAVVVPYSGEFRLWDPARAREHLQLLVDGTGGGFRTQWTDVFKPPRRRPAGFDARPWLIILLLLGWVLEISMRRLHYAQAWPAWHVSWPWRRVRRAPISRPEATSVGTGAASAAPPATGPDSSPAPDASPSAPTPAPAPAPSRGMMDAMNKVKRKHS